MREDHKEFGNKRRAAACDIIYFRKKEKNTKKNLMEKHKVLKAKETQTCLKEAIKNNR